jgi:carboxyl-terminal processing protease
MPMRNVITLFVAALISVLCYERAARNRYVGTLTEAMNIIDEHYVEPVDSRELFEGAMDGMLAKLDPYSSYTNPRSYQQFQESLDQRFGGIGILVEVDPETKRLTVMNPLVGTPAHKAGIKPGDVILSIDGNDTKDMPLEKSVTLMRGPEGSVVKVTLQHATDDEPYELQLKRAKIPIESVLGDTRDANGIWDFHLKEDPRIGLIRISTFGEQTTEEFRQALETFAVPGQEIQALVIDLRSNPGGLLNAARDISDMFLDAGVIVTTRGRGGVTTNTYSAEAGVLVDRDIPIAVLVDRFTASASEIVAAALQDHGRAVVVGERTWGKGTVQNIAPLEGGRSAMRLTTATYWRPSEKNIHKKKDALDTDDWGVQPNENMQVVLTDEEHEKVVKQRRDRDFAALRGGTPRSQRPEPQSPAAESPAAESPAPKSIEAKPLESNDTQPNDTQPNDTQPNDTQPNDTQPNDTQPNGTQPNDTEAPPATPTAPPVPQVNDDPTTSDAASTDSEQPSAAADTPLDDPQLRKAIDYLKQQLTAAAGPQAA